MSVSFPQKQKSINDDNNEKLKDQISDVLKQKKKTYNIGKEIVNNIDNKITKDILILQLKKDYNIYKEEEKNKIKNLEEVKISLEECEKNKIIAEKYFLEVRKTLGEFGDKLDKFESVINQLTKERNNIVSSKSEILDEKNDIKNQLQNQHDEIYSKIKKQLILINKLNKKIENLEKKKSDEEKVLKEEEAKETEKYNKLFKNYRQLLDKYNVYEKQENETEFDEMSKVRRDYEVNVHKEEIKIKLAEARELNINLKKNYEEINNKVEELSNDASLDFSPIELHFKKNFKRNALYSGSTVQSTITGNRELTSS